MIINPHGFPLPLSSAFVTLLNKELEQANQTEATGITLNFRDPGYSAESGGFHPVEIRIKADGTLSYVTDFSYVGLPPFAELAKALDFDAEYRVFQQFGVDYPLEEGRELFAIWQENFCAYYEMEVYTVTAE